MNLTLQSQPISMTVEANSQTLVLETGVQTLNLAIAGIAGARGENGGGSGVSYIQDNEPAVAVNKEILFKPTTQQLMVYDNAWKPVNLDGGHF